MYYWNFSGNRGNIANALYQNPVFGAMVVFAIAVAVRTKGITQEPAGDELYHILAARQYLIDGTLGINGGIYDRAPIFTYLVAWMYRWFGDSAVAARLPALVAGALGPTIVFIWLRCLGEQGAAWIAGLLMALDPLLIELSQVSRFYTIQHLFFILGVIGTFEITQPGLSPSRRIMLGVGVVISLLIALYFQPVTIIGSAGLALYVALIMSAALLLQSPRRIWLGFALMVGLAIVATLAFQSPLGESFVDVAQYTDDAHRRDTKFYHWMFQGSYPTLWSLLPLLAVIAARTQPRLTLLCCCVFGVAFITHTLVAWKAYRYITYSLPLFFVLCALAIVELIPVFGRLLRTVVDSIPIVCNTRLLRRTVIVTTATLIIAVLIINNPAFLKTVRNLTRDPQFLYPGGPTPTLSWRLAARTLRPVSQSVTTVISTEDLEAFYYLGRLDYVLDKDHIYLNSPTQLNEFTVDPKIRTPIISRPESLEHILACSESGLLVAMRWAMDTSYKMPPETAAFIRQRLQPIPLPPETGLVAYRWDAAVPRLGSSCPPVTVPPE